MSFKANKIFKKLLAIFSILGVLLGINLLTTTSVQAETTTEPSLKLIINSKNWNGTSWVDEGLKPASGWGDWDCNTNSIFNNIQALGIADYEDGITLQMKRGLSQKLQTEGEDGENFWLASGLLASDSAEGECLIYNRMSGKLEYPLRTTVSRPKKIDDFNYFYVRPTGSLGPEDETITGSDVYAYQYRYNYTFPTDQKEQLSEAYRSKTGLDGTYMGIAWTYTYYTYFDSQTNSYISWENPNKDNVNGGFLIYGLNGECSSGYIYHDGECYEDSYDTVQPDKPVIYAYPEEETDINIKVDYQGEFKFTYPEYNRDTGWNVRVKPNGDMVASDGNEYPYLFWEGKDYPIAVNKNEGFVVKQEDVVEFLEEKLDYMGLNSRERTDFITYWGPRMLDSEYYYINFPNEQFDQLAPLAISPQPDSVQRIFMVYEGLDQPMDVTEQELESFQRSGYSVIEWGGSELN